MEALVKILPKMKKYEDYINDVKKGNFPISLAGLSDSQKAHFIYSTKFYLDKPILVVTYNEIQLKKLQLDLQFFDDKNISIYPKKEIIYYDIDTMNKDVTMDRLSVYTKLYNSEKLIILTTAEALIQKTIPKEILFKNALQLEVGKTIELEEMKQNLVNLGYDRADMVEGRGQFSVRGGIIDIYPLTTNDPIRVEFFGEEIDSIRYFDVSTQRSIETLKEISLFPVEEFIVNKKELESIGNKILRDYPEMLEDVEVIKNGDYLTKVDKYFSYFFGKTSSLLDYVGNDTIVFIDEPTRIKTKCETIEVENNEIIEQFLEKYKIVPGYTAAMDNYAALESSLSNKSLIYLERIDINLHANRNGYSFNCREVNFFRDSVDIFVQEVQEVHRKGRIVLVLAGTKSRAKSLGTLLLDNEIPTIYAEQKEISQLDNKRVIVTYGNLSGGFEYSDLDLVVVSDENTVTKETKRSYKPSAFTEGKKVVFADLSVGDYIVHSTHGIGQYIGIHTLVVDNIKKDYIKLKYRDDDTLYIPTNQLDNIRKYIGAGDGTPKLNRLGSKEFLKTKAKVKESLRNIAKGLIELYAKRRQLQGYKYSEDTVWQSQFEEQFPYQETEDQIRCIEEVKKDMERETPMDRLLCGDVGYGKTEVAIRAAFKAVMEGKQVAYLVPTTVLAEQQFNNFAERMREFPVSCDVLNRFRTRKEQTEILRKLKSGELDIIIGTHRILQKDLVFKDLGLLIIDEEHRFGVEHKEIIKQLKNNIDVLTMTATPIPRTLHMSIVGIRDMSVIYEPPKNRRPVQTYVLEYDEEVIREAIIKELERQGQVFYLFNRVETIEKKASEISRLVPEARVAFAHGKMTGSELEGMMKDFIDKKIDVIVCTTIIESGIDIPNANTIIIEDADRLGLAQLYQIRGRVGRSDRLAYAYITYRRDKVLTEDSEKRLKAIKEFTEFGSGFKVALRDLEIRGAGNILGPEQHGHMEAVGYEMYCKLLEEAVKEISGEEVIPEFDTQIDLKISAYIPSEYIENVNQKIEVYQDIANVDSEEHITDIIDGLIDRYGDIPNEVNNLLEVSRIKNISRKLKVTNIIQKDSKIIIQFQDANSFNSSIVQVLIDNYRGRIYFSSGTNPYITFKLQNEKENDILKEILRILKMLK
jgi:transcription-repair coupling factor (superfamily II helicase)